MKISTKGRYALRFMFDLATNSQNGNVSLKSIGERQGISIKYLEQIVNILNHAGLVKSVRGPMGGYSLLKEPKDYTVGMILRSIEGTLAPVACLETEENLCERKDVCATLFVWEKLDEAIRNVIDNITLQDIIDNSNKINEAQK